MCYGINHIFFVLFMPPKCVMKWFFPSCCFFDVPPPLNSPFLQPFQVKGPTGDQIHDSRDKTSEKFEFTVHKKGLHRFCFTNKSPYHETIDFDIHVGHFAYFDQHAKDGKHPALPIYWWHRDCRWWTLCDLPEICAEHFNPLLEQIAKLEEALYNVQFEQHWLEAQTDRQALSMF